MKMVLLPHGFPAGALGTWHVDAGIHPDDVRLRVTQCGIRYLYQQGRVGRALRHFHCAECVR